MSTDEYDVSTTALLVFSCIVNSLVNRSVNSDLKSGGGLIRLFCGAFSIGGRVSVFSAPHGGGVV